MTEKEELIIGLHTDAISLIQEIEGDSCDDSKSWNTVTTAHGEPLLLQHDLLTKSKQTSGRNCFSKCCGYSCIFCGSMPFWTAFAYMLFFMVVMTP